jgi:hypothetical protein
VPVGDRAQVSIEDGHLAAHPAQQRLRFGIRTGEDQQLRARLEHGHHRTLEGVRDLVNVGTGSDEVVAARTQGRKCRLCLLDNGNLILDHVLDVLAAQRDVGIPELGIARAEHGGHPVGPAHVAAVRCRVAEPFGEAVPHRDPASPARHVILPQPSSPRSRAQDAGPIRPYATVGYLRLY